MLIKSVLFTVILVLFGICAKTNFAVSLEQEEYIVYDVLLEQMFIGEKTNQLVIEGITIEDDLYQNYPDIHKKLIAKYRDTSSDFIFKNEIGYELGDNFSVKTKINLLRGSEREELFKKLYAHYDGWDNIFIEKYPKSGNLIVSFSRVGFNEKKTKALVIVGYQCGWTCGEGNYVLLTKEKVHWKIKKKTMKWIS